MKKTLLSIIAGFMVMGTAFAVPSVAERKNLCEKYPDKYVWVERTQACVPIHPCASNDWDIRSAYCDHIFLYVEEAALKDVAIRDKLLKKALNTRNITKIEDSHNDCVWVESWQLSKFFCESAPVLLVNYDGTYVEIPYGYDAIYTANGAACKVYGGNFMRGIEDVFEEPKKMPCLMLDGGKAECADLAHFVSDLNGKTMKYTYDPDYEGHKVCWIEGANAAVDEEFWWGD